MAEARRNLKPAPGWRGYRLEGVWSCTARGCPATPTPPHVQESRSSRGRENRIGSEVEPEFSPSEVTGMPSLFAEIEHSAGQRSEGRKGASGVAVETTGWSDSFGVATLRSPQTLPAAVWLATAGRLASTAAMQCPCQVRSNGSIHCVDAAMDPRSAFPTPVRLGRRAPACTRAARAAASKPRRAVASPALSAAGVAKVVWHFCRPQGDQVPGRLLRFSPGVPASLPRPMLAFGGL